MTPKKLFLLSLLVFSGMYAQSQVYKQGVGAQFNLGIYKESYTGSDGLNNPVFYSRTVGIAYRGALGFQMNRLMTFNVATHPFVGIFTNGTKGNKMAFDVPLLAELYFGDVDYTGGYVGAGAAFSYMHNPDFGNGMIIGPQIEGGLQFPLNDNPFTLRLAYTFGVNKPSIQAFPDRMYSKTERGLFSVGLLYVFGY